MVEFFLELKYDARRVKIDIEEIVRRADPIGQLGEDYS